MLEPHETRSIPDTLAAIERRLTELHGLAELLPGLADADYEDGEDAVQLRADANDAARSVAGHCADISADLAALRRLEREMPMAGEVDWVAEERGMVRWRQWA